MPFEDIEDVFVDEAESEPIVDAVSEPVAPVQSDSKPDSADAASENPTAGTSAKPASEPESAEAKKPDSEKGETATEKSVEELIAEAEKELENPKHPKYFKNAIGVYKTAFQKATEELQRKYSGLEAYGEPEKLGEKLDLVAKLDSIENDPETNLPTRTVRPFVDALVTSRGPETAIALMQELGRVPSPQNEGWSLVHELLSACGIDPTRIEDHRKFAANGYASFAPVSGDGASAPIPPDPDDLALVPEHLREAFISLSPAEREDVLDQKPSLMELALTAVKNRIDGERQEVAAKQDAERQAAERDSAQKRELAEAVGVRTTELVEESGSNLFNEFTESLVKNDIDQFDAILTANMVTTALHASGVEGKQIHEALTKIGVQVDESLKTLFAEWNTAASQAAYFEKTNDKAGYAAAFNRFKELENRLKIKTRPIIAAVVAHRATSAKSAATVKNTRLGEAVRNNNGLSATSGSTAAMAAGTNGGRRVSFEDIEAFD